MAQLYDHSLMLSIASQNAPFNLMVPFTHPEPPTKALKWFFQAKLTLQVVRLAQGSLDMITIPHCDKVCYSGTRVEGSG